MYTQVEISLIKKEEREYFFKMLWAFSESKGGLLQGIFEGDAFSDIPDICDSDLPPPSRDWVSDKNELTAILYFKTYEDAWVVLTWVQENFPSLQGAEPIEKEEEDWNKKWKESYHSFAIEPSYFIYPPWEECSVENKKKYNFPIQINPGSGFGTGTHETTQLCLEICAQEQNKLKGQNFLDFGCGSGILSIALALQNKPHCKIEAVDIDPQALENAQENARLNLVENYIEFSQYLPLTTEKKMDGIIANILKNVLIEYSHSLIQLLKPGGWVLLSGLLEKDILEVQSHYEEQLGRKMSFKKRKNDWYALFWQPTA